MIVGRILYAGSKLALSNQWKNTALSELSGVEGKVDVDLHCYLPMDRLLERQSAIQRTLAARYLKDAPQPPNTVRQPKFRVKSVHELRAVVYDLSATYASGSGKGEPLPSQRRSPLLRVLVFF